MAFKIGYLSLQQPIYVLNLTKYMSGKYLPWHLGKMNCVFLREELTCPTMLFLLFCIQGDFTQVAEIVRKSWTLVTFEGQAPIWPKNESKIN